ncbi:MAG: hypothetical protein KDI68_10625 [Gammaproteobacteria bacterium]|nr:hypothetical protein [Gammaproteobacteria bacterium]
MKIRSRKAAMQSRIAQEAARLLANQEAADFAAARRKAAARLNSRNQHDLPDNKEIESALREYRSLFTDAEDREQHIATLRNQAADAMRALKEFAPRLSGWVLAGTADTTTAVQLFLFAETTEQLQIRLMELQIPAQQSSVEIRHANGREIVHDRFEFSAGETDFELILLSPGDRSNPPLNPVSGRPEMGAPLAQVERLLSVEHA